MKLSEMRELLARHDIQLTKSLGQNFLHDAHQLQRIVASAQLTKADKVLEIGPGLGPLTELLLAQAGQVLAIEMDRRLVEILVDRFGLETKEGKPDCSTSCANETEAPSDSTHPNNLYLVHDDALAYLKQESHDWHDWKLVANLPYSVASPILVELAAGTRAPKMIVATLQLEVAQRLMAPTDDEHYGILTLLVQLDFAPHGWFKIPADCFFPAPNVDSACVCLERRATPLLNEDQRVRFHRIVKKAFSQRRKMMLKLLKQDWPKEKLETAFAALNISLQERAEKLSLEQFVALTKWLHS